LNVVTTGATTQAVLSMCDGESAEKEGMHPGQRTQQTVFLARPCLIVSMSFRTHDSDGCSGLERFEESASRMLARSSKIAKVPKVPKVGMYTVSN
jgi:hypothetical protein